MSAQTIKRGRKKKEKVKVKLIKPKGYWDVKENQIKFLKEFEKNHDFQNKTDWNKISTKLFRKEGGGGVLAKYNNSIFQTLSNLYPDYDFKLENRPRYSYSYWKNLDNQRNYLLELGKKLQLKTMKDWHNVKTQVLVENRGTRLLQLYNYSIFNMMRVLFPEYEWKETGLNRLPSNYWKKEENLKEFIEQVRVQFRVKKPTDWYLISQSQIRRLGKGGNIRHHGGLYFALKKLFPDIPWDEKELNNRSKRATQHEIFTLLKEMMPQYDIYEDYTHPNIYYQDTSQFVIFDIFVANLNLVIEYQGEHHYTEIPAKGPLHLFELKDEEKSMLCNQHSIQLVVVPYWIDISISSLSELINPKRS